MSGTSIKDGRDRGHDTGLGLFKTTHRPEVGETSTWSDGRTGRILATGLGLLVVAWVAVNFMFDQGVIAILSSEASSGMRAINKIDKLIGALVLFLLAADAGRARLRWVAAGFLVLGLGEYPLNTITSLLGVVPGLNTHSYQKLVELIVANTLFVVGLLPGAPPRFSWRWALAILAGLVALGAATLAATTDLLPSLVDESVSRRELANVVGHAPLPGLTGWHYAFFALPLSLMTAAAVGTVLHDRGNTVGGWLMAAMVLLVGLRLHDIFWPLPHPDVLSSTRALQFTVSATIVVGGLLELRRVATERSALLAAEQERTNRLRELTVLKADFTAMVAHELGSPLAAIQGYTDMLSSGKLDPDRQTRTLESIRAETKSLNALVNDVRAAAAVERDDFAVRPRPAPLEKLLADAAAYARTLPGDHPLVEEANAREQILADAERIGQVLRNLLSNAAKYSPEGTPIEIRAVPRAGRVRVEVADRGPGVRPEDLSRIFEKFGRCHDGNGQQAAGAGLGLYLSRRIMRAHGSDLTVESKPGEGSVFGFELEVAR